MGNRLRDGTGSDIAANGDTVNKIGTYSVAALAKYHYIPFYVFGATEDVDFSIPCGNQIPIENRSEKEVAGFFGKRTAPEGVQVYNPGFDMTPNDLITAIILETGIVHPCYLENLKVTCLLSNHGALAVGDDLDDAYTKAVYLEDAAKIYYYAKNLGSLSF